MPFPADLSFKNQSLLRLSSDHGAPSPTGPTRRGGPRRGVWSITEDHPSESSRILSWTTHGDFPQDYSTIPEASGYD